MTQPVSQPEDPIHDYVDAFLRRARWFGGKGRPFRVDRVRRVGVLPGRPGDPHVAIDLVTVAYDDAPTQTAEGATELYQLPAALQRRDAGTAGPCLVGDWEDPEFGPAHVYDAVHDRDAMALWLEAFAAEAEHAYDHRLPLAFHRLEGHDIDRSTHSTLFSGEQSNSSVAFGEDALMKVFRRVTPGVNPDIQIHEVLTRAGSDHVAALYGWLDTVRRATPTRSSSSRCSSSSCRTGTDGWDLAQASVRNLFAEADLHPHEVGGDFAGESARLGTAVAEVHEALREHFGTDSRRTRRTVATQMATRLDAALVAVPSPRGVRRVPARAVRRRLAGARRGRACSASTATSTSARPCARCAAGSWSTSRASRPSRWTSGMLPDSRCATSPACCAPSTTPRRRSTGR